MAEIQTLQRLIKEFEYLMQLVSRYVIISKERISMAKDVISLPSSQSASKNELKPSKSIPCNLSEEQAYIPSQDHDMLEDEIKRILQVAEKVRDKAATKQCHKPRVDKNMIGSQKCKSSCSPGVKGSTPRSRFASSVVKSDSKMLAKNDLKTVYQKDYSLVKAKSMPSLHTQSKSSEVLKSKTLEKESQDKKMDSVQLKSAEVNNRQSLPRRIKDFVKINKQNLCLMKKVTPRNAHDHKRVPELASRLFQSPRVNEPFLCEELALKSQLPKHSEVLMILRESHHFLSGSSRKAGKKEMALKENFIERCTSSASKKDSEPEVCGILSILLPHCGWAFGRIEIITAKDLSNIKDIISELKERLHCNELIPLKPNLNQSQQLVNGIHSEVISNENNCEIFTNPSRKDSPFWHPSVMSSVVLGVELPPFVYYDNVHEWIKFQNAVLELHEFFIQLKILESILPIIAEVLASRDTENASAEIDGDDWCKSLAKLLKAGAIMADFTGHMTVPILASIKLNNEPATNDC